MASHFSSTNTVQASASSKTSVELDYIVVVLRQDQLRSLACDSVQLPASSAAPDGPDVPVAVPHNVVTLDQHHACVLLHRSQLYLVEGASMSVVSPKDLHPSLRATAPARRPGVKTACVNCRKVAKRCDPGRPCARCKRMDLGDSCTDAPSKRGQVVRESCTALVRDHPQTLESSVVRASAASTSASNSVSNPRSTTDLFNEGLYTNSGSPNGAFQHQEPDIAGPSNSRHGALDRGGWMDEAAGWQAQALTTYAQPMTHAAPSAIGQLIPDSYPMSAEMLPPIQVPSNLAYNGYAVGEPSDAFQSSQISEGPIAGGAHRGW
ncbi:hypothetical protein BD311DRAFT_792692 [Dichomitus squalens]|uniref:Zn(2)-C6 fungal-type domain-containing protein n=1 Tax=Dichomitus squalens TaxID=114155 RepID=A0A4Q9M3W1_9APHY|nr:hypothetical protein BD311DRAFT_792692 [Dichomitus squalens]